MSNKWCVISTDYSLLRYAEEKDSAAGHNLLSFVAAFNDSSTEQEETDTMKTVHTYYNKIVSNVLERTSRKH